MGRDKLPDKRAHPLNLFNPWLKTLPPLTEPVGDGTVLSPIPGVIEKRGVGHHEIRLRVDCHAPGCNDSSCAASHQSESAQSPQLHNWTELVSNRPQAISTRAGQTSSHGEFAAGA